MPNGPGGRHDRLLIVAGVVLVLSAVAAGFVIFTGDPGTSTQVQDRRPHMSIRGGVLTIGVEKAPHTVVVREDFGSRRCRDFDVATRDFLRIDAATGLVRVVYEPVQRLTAPYSSESWDHWTTATAHGTAAQALTLHTRLYDDQPVAGSDPDDSGDSGDSDDTALPEVALDGHRLPATDVPALAESLERTLAGR